MRHSLAVAVSLFFLLLAAAAQAKDKRSLEGVVNLNTATAEELELLPGIGPAKVRGVLAYRQSRPFRTVEELLRVKGIGRKMLRTLRPYLAVSGPTTIRLGPASASGEGA